MKKLIYSFIIFYLFINFQISYSEKKRDIFLKNSSIGIGNFDFIKNLSGEINLRKGKLIFNNSFKLLNGAGKFRCEYFKKDRVDFKFKVRNMKLPFPFGGTGSLRGEGRGPLSGFSSNFTGTFENLLFKFKKKNEIAEIILGKVKIIGKNDHNKERIISNIGLSGTKINGKLIFNFDSIKNIIKSGSFEVEFINIPLANVNHDLINLGKQLDKLTLKGNIVGKKIDSYINLRSSLISLSGEINIVDKDKIDGRLKILAKKEAMGKKMKLGWFNFVLKSDLDIIVNLFGSIKKPKFKIVKIK